MNHLQRQTATDFCSSLLEIRRIFAQDKKISSIVFEDDKYFSKFNLALPGTSPGTYSRFHGKNFDTLDDHQVSFNLATIRNVIIKQTTPQEDDNSSVFEIFNRLNTGGVNLSAQEIRSSLYHSDFMSGLDRISFEKNWLYFTNKRQPDINLKDTEVLLRAFAMLSDGKDYREPMGTFLNIYAKKVKSSKPELILYASQLMSNFLNSLSHLQRDIFSVTARTRFNIAFFECAFRVICEKSYNEKRLDVPSINEEKFRRLREDKEFVNATRFATGQASNVKARYDKAREILLSHD